MVISGLMLLPLAAQAQEADYDFDSVSEDAQAWGEGQRVILLQLYNSESCPFCPAAERNLKDLAADSSIIGVSCMVDYFDSGKSGILSRPFCQAQQDVYVHMLRTGSNYTPMLVMNGTLQMPGQDLQKVSKGIKSLRGRGGLPANIQISTGHETGGYDALLPDIGEGSGKYVLRITMVKHAPDSSLFGGAVKQRERNPYNIATSLIEGGIWDGKKRVWSMQPKPDGIADGFIVTVQDQTSGVVVAAGQAELVSPVR
ncbi:MAG: hypothetical protein JWO78_296 [Micavibrio sp.]|nr:hypothetical protein [Micavibrio sp.]